MRSAQQWFSEYGESHQNPTNKAIHWVAVPLIYLTVVGLLWSIPQPQWMAPLPWLNWAVVALVPTILFYLLMSLPLAVGMLALSALCLWACSALQAAGQSVLWWSVGVFVVMWVFQFIGHHVEGKKPSFFKDMQFLLIGPAWVIGFLYRKLGIKY
ncbi:Mpo1 family 2-hydroxy fatty acid dioxygenase [Microbulbifer pacificus]|uniref:Mpo1-like protein n=1 Tax=Microbulbifer pacificus TaxID=407164 RepID=A0AAU0MYE0_9GAMM|nr:Mpo1-like protein [Microbulbifer pacificus]WOX05221.1 Mpo1-like protein [Microbulbifer pacificus]